MRATSDTAFPDPEECLAHHAFLRRLARSLILDESRSEDVVQDAWAAWLERRPGPVGSVRAWMSRVVRNLASNARRGDERRESREREVARSESVAPESVDERLELQELLIQALRRLDEPTKIALVLRYDHDLGPTEIAERTGVPLNTVKARLRRGLETLRAEIRRTNDGDRRLSSFALMGFARFEPGGAGCVIEREASSPAASTPRTLLTPRPIWLRPAIGAFGAIAIVVIAWFSVRQEDPLVAAVPRTSGGAPLEIAQPLMSANTERSAVPIPPQEPKKEATAATLVTPLLAFDWPQYAGGPSHDNYRPRKSRIRVPKVVWHIEGPSGQPTLANGDLYAGGLGLFRVNPETGETLARVLWDERKNAAADSAARGGEGETRAPTTSSPATSGDNRAAERNALAGLGYAGPAPTVAMAPVVGDRAVIVRRIADGGVSAFDLRLEHELWSYATNDEKAHSSHLPGLLVDGHFVFENANELIALDEHIGAILWRVALPGDDRIDMIPCADAQRVFVGTQAGFLLALDLRTGAEVWRVANDGVFGFTDPVVARGYVLVADRGNRGRAQRDNQASDASNPGSKLDTSPPRSACMHAYDARTGEERWRTDLRATGCSTPGIGRGFVVAGFRDVVARFDITNGLSDRWRSVPTGRNAFGSPTTVGEELVFGNLDGHLYVYDCSAESMSWSFHVPDAQVAEFVHTGDRIYVSTTNGLYALGDDPSASGLQPGFVLESK